ncbi:uncharacterized protein TNCT_438261 [Trichonephila clavata]|uniref:Uncharacterized protein n=1 Tax=Trichonephila clavata TaxID=2740835 RepID=A0A8X6HJ12_TRICU|nr:uncharacterized protein TNCT_313991 [Trichonephila clavata]GFR23928.1 uncharacterized protein TNCT_438261 [Trichonephila clavata]
MIAWIFRFIKNAKRTDVCKTSEITFSEFDHAGKTVIKLIQKEHVINSRPLTYVSEDVNDLSPLTPAMFLQEIETSDVTDIDCPDNQEINKRIRHVQATREQLKKRFRIEYLGQLRQQTQRQRK